MMILCMLPLLVMAQISDSLQRKIFLNGGVNFRDIGGYPTKDGKTVKWGKIYRGAELANLTLTDIVELEKRKVHNILDFRGPSEVEAAPDKLPKNAILISLPAGSETVGDKMQMLKMMTSSKNADSLLLPFYANTEPFEKRYKPMFQALLNSNSDSALLFHCSAGKDRTGIAAALILTVLGVDEKKVMEDYLASDYYRQSDNLRMKKMLVNMYKMDENVVDGIMGTRPQYLQATFNAIITQYGSMDSFFKTAMGLKKKDIKKLKKMYTS